MKITFPIIQKNETKKSQKILYKVIEITWHTIIPIICTYLMMHYNQPLLLIAILSTIIVRITDIN